MKLVDADTCDTGILRLAVHVHGIAWYVHSINKPRIIVNTKRLNHRLWLKVLTFKLALQKLPLPTPMIGRIGEKGVWGHTAIGLAYAHTCSR